MWLIGYKTMGGIVCTQFFDNVGEFDIEIILELLVVLNSLHSIQKDIQLVHIFDLGFRVLGF
jgi:hypothetical protein